MPLTWKQWYCWIFEHDDMFKHSEEGCSRHRWCQRCGRELF